MAHVLRFLLYPSLHHTSALSQGLQVFLVPRLRLPLPNDALGTHSSSSLRN